MHNYKVSVIIPVYNPGKYLRQCLDSVLTQTLKEIEIIAVDDGSTDGSSEILKEYAIKYDNFNTIKNPNKNGVKAARSCGLRNAHGDYIGWVDADDYVAPDMFEKLYKNAIVKNADLSYCNYAFYPDQPKRAKWVKPYKGKKDWDFLERNTVFWITLTKKELMDRLDFANLLDDISEYAKLSLLLYAKNIVYVNEELYFHRVGHESTSHKSIEGRVGFYLQGVESTRKLKEKVLKGSEYEAELEEYFDYRLIYKLLLVTLAAAYNRDQKVYKEATDEIKRMNFRKNKYTKLILDNNFGAKKSFAFRYLLVDNYQLARFIARRGMQ